jgi:hypothetical protein
VINGIIDCHVHVGDSDSGELYYGHLTGQEWLELAKAAGVVRAFAFPPLRLDGYGRANRELADWCDTTGGCVRPLARVGGRHLPLRELRLWLLRSKIRRLVERRGPDVQLSELVRFAGLKLLPHLDGVPGPEVFDRANELQLPVLTHAGRFVPPDWIERAVLPMVKTRLVLAHLGAFPNCETLLKNAVALAARNERVYLDTSGVWIADYLAYAAKRVPHKLLFGSDCPLTHPRVAWQHVEQAVRNDAILEKIGWQTTKEVFG